VETSPLNKGFVAEKPFETEKYTYFQRQRLPLADFWAGKGRVLFSA
jgi:hypothetical protein